MDKDYNKGISRRSALKRMGLLFAGAACMGMPALTSCNMETKKRIIFYFTGTGNCLYVARQLANEHTELLSIPQLVKQGRYTFEADEIGIEWLNGMMEGRWFQTDEVMDGHKLFVLMGGVLLNT